MNNEIKIQRKEIMCPDCSHRFVFSSTYRSDEYIESLKMLEEMAEILNQYCVDRRIACSVPDTGINYAKHNDNFIKILDKYREFKEGLK